jgi:transposase
MLLRSHDGGDMKDQDRARWTKLVADYEASDLTQREFASERGVSFSNLRNWIYRLRKESRPLVPEPAKVSGQAHERGAAGEGSRLLPVRVVASAPKAS